MPPRPKIEPHQTPASNELLAFRSPGALYPQAAIGHQAGRQGGQRARDIAEEVGADVGIVRGWIRAYNRGWPAVLDEDNPGGRHNCLMDKKSEDAFIAGCRQDAESGP